LAIIVITGAGAGLGRALARRFAGEGETVILLGRTVAKLETLAREIGARATGIECDVGSPASVKAAFAAIAAMHPRIDVLINNAAVFEPFLIANATDEQIMRTIGTNVAGPILCTRAALPLMGAGGQIINLSSESVDMHFPHLTLYQTTKAAVERFSKSMHHELEFSGIRVTTVRAGQMMEEGKAWDVDPAGGDGVCQGSHGGRAEPDAAPDFAICQRDGCVPGADRSAAGRARFQHRAARAQTGLMIAPTNSACRKVRAVDLRGRMRRSAPWAAERCHGHERNPRFRGRRQRRRLDVRGTGHARGRAQRRHPGEEPALSAAPRRSPAASCGSRTTVLWRRTGWRRARSAPTPTSMRSSATTTTRLALRGRGAVPMSKKRRKCWSS
jgi:meso-butanediol dehydrogenase/(S,S)-butanediol dehydrogenase/diacetyl reductase